MGRLSLSLFNIRITALKTMNHKRLLVIFCFLIFAKADLSAQEKIIICVKNSTLPPFEEALQGFKQSLAQKNIEFKLIEYDLSNPPPPELNKADLIFSMGTNPTQTISEKIKDIPIVFTLVTNPQFSSRNMTGVMMETPYKELLNILSRISPKPKRLGIIYDPKKTNKLVESYMEESREKDCELHTIQVAKVDEVYNAIRSLRPSIDCLLIIPNSTVYNVNSTEDILLFSLREGLPVVGISPNYVKAGALFSLSSNYTNLGEKAGELASRLLHGEKASDIPYASPDKFDLSINLIVAARINVTFPTDLIKEAKNVYK